MLGLPINAIMQFLWLKVGMFVYTEAAGPVVVIGPTHLPVVMVVYDSLIFAMVAVLCVMRMATVRGLVAATAILLTVVLAPVGVLSVLRVGGFAKPAYDQFPYPAVKVYDPYGDLARAGKPGPFYR